MPRDLPGEVRSGGFGGPGGLAAYLEEEGITALVDATHPFAAEISANAATAARLAGVPRLRLERPPWTPGPGERWLSLPDMNAAAGALAACPGPVFLAIGRQELTPFAAISGRPMLLRMVDAPDEGPPLPGATVIAARGPFTEADERALMTDHGIRVLVTRNAGGASGRAKLDAAHALGVTVIMVERPDAPDGFVAPDTDAALAGLDEMA